MMIFLGPEDTRRTWSPGQKTHEAAARVETRPRGGLPCGPLGSALTYFFVLYIHIYSKTVRGSHKNTFLLFLNFTENQYQTESKRNKTL